MLTGNKARLPGVLAIDGSFENGEAIVGSKISSSVLQD
ncbi:hypothetical protein Q31a_16780 [Aureliella helgolandensis]|uniref:Uncharacterized protein n=2 Tax=Aureliella helgolandensis TaxID=2527968 RepID=A0A518G493_9BACT|nr:hypothetical protein Q31a_16780 [Aureliella helgolandensis]